MSGQYFEGKIKFIAQQDNGLFKPQTELYLIDALTFTEAESRIIEECAANNRKEMQLLTLRRSNILEVIEFGDTDVFHRTKVFYELVEEEGEKAKRVTIHFLVNASDPQEATERTREHLKEMLVPYTIEAAGLTKFVDVIKRPSAQK